MKLIHTADWHIGQTFYEYDRREEHEQFLQWLQKQIIDNDVDALLISGDLFDSQNPSATSQRMYYRFLHDITAKKNDLQIIITSGNHDSAARLEAPEPLLSEMNISVRGIVKKDAEGVIDLERLIVPLKNGGACLAVPFLRHGDYPQSGSYGEGVNKLYTQLIEKANMLDYKPIIAMGHMHATGSELSTNDNSERATVGSLDGISPDVFVNTVAYTALGHLHKAQRVSRHENIRYAGAPLPMSFAECNYKQSVTLVTIEDETSFERLYFDAPAKLLSVPNQAQELHDVLNALQELPDGEINHLSSFLEVKVLVTQPNPSMRREIELALEGKAVRLARIKAVSPEEKIIEKKVQSCDDLKSLKPLDIAYDAYAHKYNEEMPEKLKLMLESVIRECETEE